MAAVTAFTPARVRAHARALAADHSPAAASVRAEAALAAAPDARARRASLRERRRLAAEIARAALNGAVVDASRPPRQGGVQVHPLDVVEALLRQAAAMLATHDEVPPAAAARMAGAAARRALATDDGPTSP